MPSSGTSTGCTKQFGDRVQFVNVYVREAHPTDGWRMSSNDRDGVTFAQPTTDAERCEVASKCCAALQRPRSRSS